MNESDWERIGRVLPPQPLPPAAPPKRKLGPSKIVLLVLGALLVLSFANGSFKELVNQDDPPTAPANSSTSPASASCIDKAKAAGAARNAVVALDAGSEAAKNGNASLAAMYANEAAYDFDRAAQAALAYPTISEPSQEAAQHLRAIAGDLSSGNYQVAADELQTAAAAVGTATDAIHASTVPAC